MLPRRTIHLTLSILVIVIGAGSLAASASGGSTDPASLLLASGALHLSPGVSTYRDPRAPGGWGLRLPIDSSATLDATLFASNRITVNASAPLCERGSTLGVAADGTRLRRREVIVGGWRNYVFLRQLPAGSGTVTISYRGASTPRCKGRLLIDGVRITSVATPAPSTLGSGATSTGASGPSSSETSPTTTAPATPTIPPSGAGASPNPGFKLRWAPPALTDPTTIQLGTGNTTTTMDPTKDYIVEMPNTIKLGTTVLNGGHNVVLIGGQAQVPVSDGPNGTLAINGATGTVHIEGLLIDGTGGANADGIDIEAPNAVVQIENSRIVNLTGSYSGYHDDVVQPWGGVAALEIDHLTGSSDYQGLFLRPDQGPIGPITLQNVNLSYTTGTSGGYLLWLSTGCETAPSIALSNVYVQGRPTVDLGHSIWPPDYAQPAGHTENNCLASVTNGVAAWPNLPVTGNVTDGSPPTGDYVPAGAAGIGYVSPGYE